MRRTRTTLSALTLGPLAEELPIIDQPKSMGLLPGQSLLTCNPERGPYFYEPLFPIGFRGSSVVLHRLPSSSWKVGDTLEILGPLGPGFHPPLATSRWLVLAYGVPVRATLPLIDQSVEQRVSTVLWSTHPIPDPLPAEVEISPHLEEALRWAESVTCEIDMLRLPELLPRLQGTDRAGKLSKMELLVHMPMPCGIGACGACMIHTHRGWKYACVDGPLWMADQLRE